jgi:hypothetical protein
MDGMTGKRRAEFVKVNAQIALPWATSSRSPPPVTNSSRSRAVWSALLYTRAITARRATRDRQGRFPRRFRAHAPPPRDRPGCYRCASGLIALTPDEAATFPREESTLIVLHQPDTP